MTSLNNETKGGLMKTYYKITFLFLVVLSLSASGCARHKKTVLSPEQALLMQNLTAENQALNEEVDRLARERSLLQQELDGLGLRSKGALEAAKLELEKRLRSEMEQGNLTVGKNDRGLVVTVLNRILFAPGLAELKESSKGVLGKVADVLKEQSGTHMVYVEGHTDSDPITKSSWKSNWELSAARALEVVHFLIDEKGLTPQQIAASGYGEFQPVASNATPEGKLKNRRVEIVVSPQKLVS